MEEEFNPAMSFITPPQEGRRQFRTGEAAGDFQPPNLSFLQNMQPSPLGLMLSSTPVEFGHSTINTQDHQYPTPMFSNYSSPSLRSIGGIEGARNPSDGLNGSSAAIGIGIGSNPNSNYSQPLSEERRTMWSNNSSSNVGGGGYGVYDERFQAMGLSVDPHLRIFNATNGNGKSSA